MTSPPVARGLLLDIGGVVLRHARELVRMRDDDTVAAYVEEQDVAGPGDAQWQAMLRHEITEREYWAYRARDLGRALGHDDWSTRDLITWLYHVPDGEFLDDEVVDLVRDAQAAGIPVVAFTNDLVDFHGQAWADAQAWLQEFDAVVDASLTGVLKPDPGAYALALDAVGVPAGEVVFLDDMPVNVQGGLDAGLQAIEVRYAERHAAVAEARRRLGLSPT